MDNYKIKLIKNTNNEKKIDIPENNIQNNLPKKKPIGINSPLIKRLKEAEEKTKQMQKLSDDELIELEFKEQADEIRSRINKDETKLIESKEALKTLNVSKDINVGLDYIQVTKNPQTRNFYDLKDSKPNITQPNKKIVDIKRAELPNSINKNIEEINPINTQNKPIEEIRQVIPKIITPTKTTQTLQNQIQESMNKTTDFINELATQKISNEVVGIYTDNQFDINEIEHKVEIVDKIDDYEINIPKERAESLLYQHIIGNNNIIDDTLDEEVLNEMNKSLAIAQKKLEERIKQIKKKNSDIDNIYDTQKQQTFNEIENQNQYNKNYNSITENLDSMQQVLSKSYKDNVNNSYEIGNVSPSLTITESSDKIQENFNKEFQLPPIELLNAPLTQKVDIDDSEIDVKVHNLFNKLRVFKIEGDIVKTYSGPVVTTFEFRPAANVKVSRIQNLQDDLSMALKATSIRIQAPIPGKDVVGIEIPNNRIQTIYLREIFESNEFKNSRANLAIALGKDVIGNPVIEDLSILPHLLIAGTTGSGKSVGLNAMILSLLYKNTPKDLRFIMIDPKFLEFGLYKDIPHLLTPIITDPKKAIIALSKAVEEMNRRYEMMDKAKVKTITGYNELALENGLDKLPYIVIIIDEFADLMIMGGREAEQYLISLAGKARASGIHLIIATQRPTVNVVTGLIKGNLPSKISYRVGSKIDSKVILDETGAEALLGKGDMLFSKTNSIVRLHAPYNDEKEIEKIVEFIKTQQKVEYDEFFSLEQKENFTQPTQISSDGDYMQRAKEIILQTQKTSISYLQRSLGVGFNKAASIIEQLENEGFLSQPNSKGLREIIGN
ncbi:DNA translocase FtsK [Helicobacter sp. MIT 14-3879]|uniref:DNA translocase FtsK n=1 Tax=Helicobacter sp. MIT 14-3879 TaxID=2040649 RepID=UPI000E1E31BB|nr:DNA translocase FtsK [Helicobacter sp. MIT 14-3879]RDU65242.1 DNA translocase FtsK [Helicobacter sp. MIT 14-3879]